MGIRMPDRSLSIREIHVGFQTESVGQVPFVYPERELLRAGVKRFQNGSVNLTLKNIPEPVYAAIKREAKRNRRSLNAEILRVLEEEAAEAERRRNLKALLHDMDQFVASQPPMEDSTPLIRRARGR